MFRKTREMQSLINASRKSLANAEERIEQRNEFIKTQQEETKQLKLLARKQNDLLADIFDRAVKCPLGSEKIVLDKIKELVRDYQSNN